MNQLIWADVPGYEGLYRINVNGKIVSLHEKNYYKELTQRISNKGYWTVRLSKNAKQTIILVHRLIALAFVPNPDNKPYVNHKNGNKLDYQISNLEWVTAKENMKHAFEQGLCYRFKPNNRAVIDNCNGKRFKSITKAAEAYGLPYSTLLGYLSGYRENKTCLQFAPLK